MKMDKQANNTPAHTFYEKEYHEIKHKYLYTNPKYYKARAELARRRYFDDNLIGDLSKKKILEFGIGLGQNLFCLSESKRIGYDISRFAVAASKSKGIPSTTNISDIPNDVFDIVFSAHVIEHVDNPLETLRVIHSKLRKGGKLILVTPLDKPKKMDNLELKTDVNQHLWTWTPQLMVNLLTKAGFKPIDNKIISTCAYKKLLPLRRLGLTAYDRATRLAGVLMRDRELKFVAVKE